MGVVITEHRAPASDKKVAVAHPASAGVPMALFALLLAMVLGNASAYAGVPGALLKPPLSEDPRRSRIREIVRASYPDLFSSSAAPGWVAITLLMNDDGTLYKGYQDDTRMRPYITGKLKAFEALGAEYEKYGDRIQVDMRGGYAGSTRIYVRAYLPQRASGPPGEVGPAAPNDDPAVNRAIAEKYFPDLYTYTTPRNESVADFWVLLDREGRVLATGRRYILGRKDLKLYLESLYPGIKTNEFQPTELKSDHGRPAVVNFMWLAADSPVTNLSRTDLSKRANVAIYANVSDGQSTAETTLGVSRFGVSSMVVCDDQDLDLQITAQDGRAGTVILRARIQHVARKPPAEFEFGTPNAVETAWSAFSAPVRVRYGESAEIDLADQDHKT